MHMYNMILGETALFVTAVELSLSNNIAQTTISS